MTTKEFKRKVANEKTLRQLDERLNDLETIIRLMNKHSLDCSKIIEMREEARKAFFKLYAEMYG